MEPRTVVKTKTLMPSEKKNQQILKQRMKAAKMKALKKEVKKEVRKEAKSRPPAKRWIPPGQRGRPPGSGYRNYSGFKGEIVPAPVSSISNMRSGQKVVFRGAGTGLVANFHFRVAQIAVNSGANNITFLLSSGNAAQELTLNVTNSFYFPSCITNITRLFETFKVFKCHCSYEPRSITTRDASFIFASPTDDIGWIEAHGGTSGGLPNPTENLLTSLQNACTVIDYGRCAIKIPPMSGPQKGRLFTMGENISTQISYTNQSTPSLRLCCGGQLLIVGTPGAVTANSILGDLYMDLEMGLYDYSIAATQGTTLLKDDFEKIGPLEGKCEDKPLSLKETLSSNVKSSSKK